jgi:transcriptional regulator with XRE-family HTH domain
MLYLEFLRRARHLTQAQLAAATGVKQLRISEYERGLRPERPPGRANVRALAGFFGLPPGRDEHLLEEVPANIAEVPPAPDLAARIREARGR